VHLGKFQPRRETVKHSVIRTNCGKLVRLTNKFCCPRVFWYYLYVAIAIDWWRKCSLSVSRVLTKMWFW
jgi:hypothetical protein